MARSPYTLDSRFWQAHAFETMIAAWSVLFTLLSLQNPVCGEENSTVLLRVSTAGELTGDELLQIGEIHDHQNHFRETLTYYQLTLSAYREKKQPAGVVTVLVKIARVYERQGRFQDAYVALQEAILLYARSADRRAHAQALLIMGRVSIRLGRDDVARQSLTQAITLFDRLKDRRGWNEASVQLGLLQIGDGLAERGLSLLEQARHDAQARQDGEQQLAALMALGNAQRLLERSTDARPYYEDGLLLAQAQRNMPAEAALRLRLAHLDDEDGLVAEGIESGKQAVLLSQTLRDPAMEAEALSLLADLYRKAGHRNEADESGQRALSIYRHRQIFVHGAG